MATNQESSGGQPLDGVILCCTSISPDKRSELASVASQMGAIHKYDLTSDVTHLIVGDADTPKYKFVARERPDVKCLLPTWVEALRELWLEGGEPDVQALELRHTLPALHQLRICVTGFEDIAYRKQLEDHVNSNGGEYRANLTKDVTHLIAKEASGAKYKYAVDWNINIVAVDWLEQSLERGMILDEKLYNLSTPPAERGRGAWIRRTVSTSSLRKRPLDRDAVLNGPRKLRRVASTKLSSHNIGLWTDIVSGDIKAEAPKRDQWSEQPLPQNSSLLETSSTSCVSRGTSMGTPSGHPGSSATTVKTLMPPMAPPMINFHKAGIFAGKTLYLHGFNEKKTAVLHKHLLSHDAKILSDWSSFTLSTMPSPDNEFFLVPHDMPKDQLPTIPEFIHPPVVVTDMWIERNLHRKQYIRPQANVTNTPFQKFPIPGFDCLTVCSTRFEGVDLLHMSKAVKLMGATYDEDFTPKASVLVCHQVIPGHEKLRHAQHWNIPTVTAEWLWASVGSGELQPFGPYLVQPYSRRPVQGAQKQSVGQIKDELLHGTDIKTSHRRSEVAVTLADRKLKTTTSIANPNDDEASSHGDPTEHRKSPTKPPPPFKAPESSLPKSAPPLQEISHNSSPPKPSTSPSVPAHTIKPLSSDSSLSSAITSLLALKQTARSSASSASAAIPPPRPHIRRKRQLLGRAPSNASNLSLSRASSVDTVNTDGVGTPVEPTNQATISSYAPSTSTHARSGDDTSNQSHFNPLAHYDEDDHERQKLENQALSEQHLQMTQLGYEDPDALAWREKVIRKLGGAGAVVGGNGDGDGDGGRRRVKEIGVVKDVVTKAVGKRTRQAAGR